MNRLRSNDNYRGFPDSENDDEFDGDQARNSARVRSSNFPSSSRDSNNRNSGLFSRSGTSQQGLDTDEDFQSGEEFLSQSGSSRSEGSNSTNTENSQARSRPRNSRNPNRIDQSSHSRTSGQTPFRSDSPQDSQPKSALHEMLKRVSVTMQEWRNTRDTDFDPRTYILSINQVLQNIARGEKISHLVLKVMGSQSAGKTTLNTAITGQVVFFISSETGTRARTLIRVIFVASKTRSVRGDIFFKRSSYTNLTADQMIQRYEDITNTIKGSGDGFSNDTITVELHLSDPSFGVTVEDHPGINVRQRDETSAISQTSINESFQPGQPPQGIVLLCEPVLTTDLSNYTTHELDLQNIPEGHLYFALTKMDSMPVFDWANRIRAHLGLTDNSTEDIKLTPLEILQHMETIIKRSHPSGNTRPTFPDHTRVFFVASCRMPLEDIKRRPESERKKAFENSQSEAHTAMLEKLMNASEWAKSHITLLEMDTTEQADFESKLGVQRLTQQLLQRQYEGALSLSAHLKLLVKTKKFELENKLKDDEKARSSIRDFSESLLYLIRDTGELYHSIITTGPVDDNHKELLNALTTNNHGYTLADEYAILSNLKNCGSFPPEKYRKPGYDNEQAILEKLSTHVETKIRLYRQRTLFSRLISDIVLRTLLVEFGPADPVQIAQNRNPDLGVDTVDIKKALADHILVEYENIYKAKKNGANLYIAIRLALTFLLNAQPVIDVLWQLPKYRILFPERNDTTSAPADAPQHVVVLPDLIRENSASQTGFCLPKQNAEEQSTRSIKFDLVPISELHSTVQSIPASTPKLMGDMSAALIAMFFDKPFFAIQTELEQGSAAFATQIQTTYLAATSSVLPLLLHQDPAFVNEYAKSFPQTDFVQTFIKSHSDPPEETDQGGGNNPPQNEQGTSSTHSQRRTRIPGTSSSIRQNMSLYSVVKRNPQLQKLYESIIQLNHEEKVDLLMSIVRENTGTPDHLIVPEIKDTFKDMDIRSMDYVKSRYLSAAIFETLHSMMRITTSFGQQYLNPNAGTMLSQELLSRVASLFLGYEYPFSTRERAKSKAHKYLDPLKLIPFLKRNLEHLLTKSDSKILGHEKMYAYSPLVTYFINHTRTIVATSKGPEFPSGENSTSESLEATGFQHEDNQNTIRTKIDNLYDSYCRAEFEENVCEENKEQHYREIDETIIRLLAAERYNNNLAQNAHDEVDKTTKLLDLYRCFESDLDSYHNFLWEYGEQLGLLHSLPQKLRGLRPS